MVCTDRTMYAVGNVTFCAKGYPVYTLPPFLLPFSKNRRTTNTCMAKPLRQMIQKLQDEGATTPFTWNPLIPTIQALSRIEKRNMRHRVDWTVETFLNTHTKKKGEQFDPCDTQRRPPLGVA
jgi:hypothetical protein